MSRMMVTTATAPPAPLDGRVTDRLRRLMRRVRACVLMEGLARGLAFLLAGCLVEFCIDYFTRGVRWSIRAAMMIALLAGWIWILRKYLIQPLRRRFGPAEAANLIERHHPTLGSRLISAVRFASGEIGPPESNSRELAAQVVRRAVDALDRIDVGGVIDTGRAKRAGAALIGLLAVVAAMVYGGGDLVGLWFSRNVLLQEVPWPKRTHLVVDCEGDEIIGARGDDLVIEAYARGVQPREVEILFETTSGRRGRESMVTVGSPGNYRYRYTFKNAQEDFTFHLRGGDDRTDLFRARLLERPRVVETAMRIEPPAYTHLDPILLGDGQRAARVLPGSTVHLEAHTNKPIAQAVLMAGRDRVTDAEVQEDRVRATVRPMETHTYHFALVDRVNLENRRPVRFSLRVVKDEAPKARLLLPGVGDMITPQAVLPMELEFSDEYGLAQAEVVYRISREEEVEGRLSLPEFRAGMKTLSASLSWPVAEQSVAPGEVLTLSARASDFDDVSGPNVTQTPEVSLRVVTREEFLAELARREQQYRQTFERLVDEQEQLRGKLLTLLGKYQRGGDPEALAAELTPLERRQRSINGSVNVIRQQFERHLAELRINRLNTADEEQRIQKGIVDPLTKLVRRDMVAAADALRAWARDADPEKAAQIDPQQAAILADMRSVLANMIQWEGYQEVVNMLRDIIRLQQELRAETEKTIEKEASDVFDDQ